MRDEVYKINVPNVPNVPNVEKSTFTGHDFGYDAKNTNVPNVPKQIKEVHNR